MEKVGEFQNEIKIGEPGYVNKNCWLAKNLNYPPTKHCQYCESKFPECLFFRYLIITLSLISFIIAVSFIIKENVSRLVVLSIFSLVLVYGYFFSRSTEEIIIANFFQKKSKESFRDLSQTLQRKVDEQTKDIRKAYEIEKQAHEELKKLDQNKTEFMLVTQHHLRTPLSVNMGFLDLLMEGQFGKIPAKIKKVISGVRDSMQKETNVVNELLDVSSYQLGKENIHLVPGTDIEALLEETLKDLRVEAKNIGIYLRVEKSGDIPKIPIDRIKIKLVLTNIIDNAIKYTKQGGVTIGLKEKNNKLLISVKDTGMGMAKDVIPNLFNQTFHRSKEAQKVFAVGKGLGLFLSAKIIEQHKGKIWAESEGEGKGSCFFVELPIDFAEPLILLPEIGKRI